MGILYLGNQKVTPVLNSGTTPSGTVTITQNGTHDVTNYASASVNVSGGGSGVGIPREVSQTGVYQLPSSNYTFSLPSNATDLGSSSLKYAFSLSTHLTSLDLSSLTSISGSDALAYCCEDCSGLTTVDLSNLITISGNSALFGAFGFCSNLSSIDLSNLSTISSSAAFREAFTYSSIQSLSFPSLSYIESGSNFKDMLIGVTGCTVHFPSNLQSVIGGWSDVTAGFSGINTTVLFDLPATA